MSFSADWLALREPADHAARDKALLAAAGAVISDRAAPLIVDLGCGAGSNVRALRPHASADAQWRLVDQDPALLALVAAAAPGAETAQIDLATSVGAAIDGADLVTAAAFFDLVSAAWIDQFVEVLSPNAAVYAVLTYDGVESWSPDHMDDAAVLGAFIQHQQTDKGFGPALGPQAADYLAGALKARGYDVKTAVSPWRLTRSEHGGLMDELADGVAAAAQEIGVEAAAWRAAPRTSCEIGHIDILATPPKR